MSVKINVQAFIEGKFYEGEAQLRQVKEGEKKPEFPDPYANMLEVTDKGDHWQVKPRHFLPTEHFTEIAKITKQYEGQYVTFDKETKAGGLWQIPK